MKAMNSLDLGAAPEIILPANPAVRAKRVLDFLKASQSQPFKRCQSGRVDVGIVFYFKDTDMPKFTNESDKNLFIQEVSNVIGMAVKAREVLDSCVDTVERVVQQMEATTTQPDLPFPTEPHAPEVEPSHEDSPEVMDDARAGAADYGGKPVEDYLGDVQPTDGCDEDTVGGTD